MIHASNGYRDADKESAAHYGERSCFNGFRNKIQELTNPHWDNPFSFLPPADKRRRKGNSRQKHTEGTVQKASNPKWSDAGSR